MNTAILPGFSRYEVLENGTVRYKTTKKICPDHESKDGYRKIRLYPDGKKKRQSFWVHRLIWQAFRCDILPGMQIDHVDGLRFNNTLENLMMVTPSQNCRLKKQREANLFTKRKGRKK